MRRTPLIDSLDSLPSNINISLPSKDLIIALVNFLCTLIKEFKEAVRVIILLSNKLHLSIGIKLLDSSS